MMKFYVVWHESWSDYDIFYKGPPRRETRNVEDIYKWNSFDMAQMYGISAMADRIRASKDKLGYGVYFTIETV